MTVPCPKCGHVGQPSETAPEGECPRCGIVYAKYGARAARPPGPAEDRSPSGPLTLETCMGLTAAAGAGLLLLKGSASGCTWTDALLLVPFFFCFVPVLSYTFGEGLYLWNKYRMRFELYDSEEHPVLSKAYYVFLIAATGAFVFFMFMPKGKA